MALKDIVSTAGQSIATITELLSFVGDLMSIRSSEEVSKKLTKFGMTPEDAQKSAEHIEKIRVHIGGIGTGDERIMTDMIVRLDFQRRQVFLGFMSWLKKNHIMEHNFVYKHLFINAAEVSIDRTLVIIEDLIRVLQEPSNTNKDVLEYCRATYLAYDSTYQRYLQLKKLLFELPGKTCKLIKEGADFVNTKCADDGPVDLALQSARTKSEELRARALRFKAGGSFF